MGVTVRGKNSVVGNVAISHVAMFKGDKGDDYVLTDSDKIEIAKMAAELVDSSVPDYGGNTNATIDGETLVFAENNTVAIDGETLIL